MRCKICGKEYPSTYYFTTEDVCTECYEKEQPEEKKKGSQTEKVLMEAKGVSGQIEVLEDKVRIKRKGLTGFLTHGLKGDKEILIAHISSIQFKKAGIMTNGYIQFAYLGGQEAKGGLFEATKDENTVMFNTFQQKSFEAIKQTIEQRMAASKTGAKATLNLDELEKLASLRDRGIITEEEFNTKKRQL
ncbi:MAG: SHOCT domain-containing protein, partial [bacterium]